MSTIAALLRPKFPIQILCMDTSQPEHPESPTGVELPVSLIRSIRSFPKPHEDLFELAQEVPDWQELLQSVPTLAFLVARCWIFDNQPQPSAIDRIRRYSRLSRNLVCGALGFPAESRTLKILLRMTAWQHDAIPFLILRELLRYEPAIGEILEDLSEITEEHLARLTLGSKNKLRLAIPSLRHIDHLQWFFRLPALKRFQIGMLYDAAGRNRDETERQFLEPIRPLASFRNGGKATAYLRAYAHRREAIKAADRTIIMANDPAAWPPPPITGTARIAPITSFAEATRESEIMNHCVMYHSAQVLRGEHYLYRILGSQRGTLQLRFHRGEWILGQFRGRNNETISDPAIWKEIEDWHWNAPSKERRTSLRLNYLNRLASETGMAIRTSVDRENREPATA